MSITFYSVFELPQDFTIDDLNKAFQAKQELSKTKLSQVEATVYNEALENYYLQAKRYLRRKNMINTIANITLPDFNDFNSFSIFPSLFFEPRHELQLTQTNQTNQIYSSSSSYREQLMPDGSKIVLKESSSNNNGNITKNTNSFRKLPDGTTQPVEYNEALQSLQTLKNIQNAQPQSFPHLNYLL